MDKTLYRLCCVLKSQRYVGMMTNKFKYTLMPTSTDFSLWSDPQRPQEQALEVRQDLKRALLALRTKVPSNKQGCKALVLRGSMLSGGHGVQQDWFATRLKEEIRPGPFSRPFWLQMYPYLSTSDPSLYIRNICACFPWSVLHQNAC